MVEYITKHQAQGVSQGRLAPDQAVLVDDLGGAVDIPAPDPGGRHGEDPDEHADVPSGQHDFLLQKHEHGWMGMSTTLTRTLAGLSKDSSQSHEYPFSLQLSFVQFYPIQYSISETPPSQKSQRKVFKRNLIKNLDATMC